MLREEALFIDGRLATNGGIISRDELCVGCKSLIRLV